MMMWTVPACWATLLSPRYLISSSDVLVVVELNVILGSLARNHRQMFPTRSLRIIYRRGKSGIIYEIKLHTVVAFSLLQSIGKCFRTRSHKGAHKVSLCLHVHVHLLLSRSNKRTYIHAGQRRSLPSARPALQSP